VIYCKDIEEDDKQEKVVLAKRKAHYQRQVAYKKERIISTGRTKKHDINTTFNK